MPKVNVSQDQIFFDALILQYTTVLLS